MPRPLANPTLAWPGRVEPAPLPASPLQTVARFRPADTSEPAGRLILGDNLGVLTALLTEGLAASFELIYIDPPFAVGTDFRLPGGSRTRAAPTAYSDRWSLPDYLQMLLPRLALLRELLSSTGSLWIHADRRAVHHIRVLADELFGPRAFLGEVVWSHQVLGAGSGNLSKMHETLLRYGKTPRAQFHPGAPEARVPFSDYIRKSAKQDETGRWYYERRAVRADDKGRNLRTHFDPDKGKTVGDLWLDLPSYQPPGNEKWGYPTQKPEALLRRIVALSSSPGDLVGDFFCGSGTTLAVAADMGRRFIGCDAGAPAIHVACKRLACRERPVAFDLQLSAGPQSSIINSQSSILNGSDPPWSAPAVTARRQGDLLILAWSNLDPEIDLLSVDLTDLDGVPCFTHFVGRTRKLRDLPSRVELPLPAATPTDRQFRLLWSDTLGRSRATVERAADQ